MLEKINRSKRSPKNKNLANKNIKSAKCENKLNSGKNVTTDKTNKKQKKLPTVSTFKSGTNKLSAYQNDIKYLKEIDPYNGTGLTKSLTDINLKSNSNITKNLTAPQIIPIIEFRKLPSAAATERNSFISENSDSNNNLQQTSDILVSSLNTINSFGVERLTNCSKIEKNDEKLNGKVCDTEEPTHDENHQNEIVKNNEILDNNKTELCDTKEQILDDIVKKSNVESCEIEAPILEDHIDGKTSEIPEVLRKQGTASNCSANVENNCPCNTMEAVQQVSKQITYCNRKTWITVDRMNELRKKAQDALKSNKTFTIRGCFFSIRNALTTRGWVEKLDVHRKHVPNGVCQVTYEDLAQTLPKRRPGETRRQYVIKCERNIMSRFLEHMPINFLWTARKEKCDYIDQAKNPSMIINKFARVPFTSKEGLCNQLKDFHWFYEEGTVELYFPRCYNAWSPEELSEFIENFRTTSCISFLKWLVDKYRQNGYDGLFSVHGKIPFTAIDFACKRCNNYIDNCCHNDIDIDHDNDNSRIWDHDWDAFFSQHFIMTQENAKITSDQNRNLEPTIINAEKILDQMQEYWPQYNLDGYFNLWIIKPANKCRGRGIQLTDNLKKIMQVVNPAITSKSRYVVQKYIERPLIIHNTKFDIRQWFMVSSVQPLVIWMYKESYLRFSSQDFNLTNHHESVHLTNHAIQKKYRINGKRDKRLPNENMWDSYSFQAYLRQIGQHNMWTERIYPGMRRAIIGSMLASQESMDRRTSTFELFGADFMISEDFYPWLIEINSSPDLGATTSVTARMCPQCLEDVIKVIIDKRIDQKADTGNFEVIYRQVVPPTPAYMGLNLFLKGKQILPRTNNHHHHFNHNHYSTNHQYYRNNKERSSTSISIQRQAMPTINFQGSPPRINTGGNPELCSVLQFMDKSSNCNPREFITKQHNFTIDPNYSGLRKSSLITTNNNNSNQFIRQSTTLDMSATTPTINTYSQQQQQQNARLLTPIIQATSTQSNHRTKRTQQLMLSPRGTLIGDRRRSNEITSWKNFNDTISKTTKHKTNYSSNGIGSMSRRHFSCGPRISSTTNPNASVLPIKNSVISTIKSNDDIQQNIIIVDDNNGDLIKTNISDINAKSHLIRNKLNLDLPLDASELIITENTTAVETSLQQNPVGTNNVCRKKIYEILYKSKSAGRLSRSTKSLIGQSLKSSPNSSNTVNTNNSSSSSTALLSYRKNCLLNKKNVQISNSNGNTNLAGSSIGCGGGIHTKERLSFRAWRSKQLAQDICNNDININSKLKTLPLSTCRSAPITHLSPNKRRIDINGGCMINSNSNINLGTNKKFPVRVNTRC